MKKFKILSLFSFLLTFVALLMGADLSMAAATPTPQTDAPQSQTASPDTKGLNTDLSGTPATEAGITGDPDFNDDEIDNLIVKFRPFNYTLTTDIETIARQKKVTDYKQEHAAMATPIMDCTLQKATSLTSTGVVELTIGTGSGYNISGDAQRMFGRSQTVHVKGVDGYTQDQQNTVKGELVLKVVSRTSAKITLIPVNGYYTNGQYEVPAMPVGTKLQMMATAGHTAQLAVSPKNTKPVLVDCYLQKKIMNTTIEEEWKEKKKKLPFFTEDIKDNGMMVFRQENERTKLCGVPNVLQENDEELGIVNCYYEEGVLTQLLMKYCTNGNLTFRDLISMQRMQFGKWSMSNVAEVYCSYGFIEQLLNLDFTKVAQTNILTEQTTFGINITKFKTSFGTFNFKLCPILDEMGYEDCAMVIDMKNATHYWKKPNKGDKTTVDLSKQGKEPLEATRDIHVKIDCICLRGYNSMLIGPANVIYHMDTVYDNVKVYDFYAKVSVSSNDYYLSMDSTHTGGSYDGSTAEKSAYFIGNTDVAEGTAPTELVDGLLIMLHDSALTFNAGDIIQYDASTTSWKKYSGALAA